MHDTALLEKYPVDRLIAVDGMAVTADIWTEAHDYHRAIQRILTRYSVGHGVLTGLDVVPSDPADKSVFISPGLAIDHDGNLVVVQKPVPFEVGNSADGVIYLVMTYGEGRARAKQGASPDAPLYVTSQYIIEALPQLPDYAHIELARINRSGRSSAITAAHDIAHPQKNELDLRFRVSVIAPQKRQVTIGVLNVGVVDLEKRLLGLRNLARYINRQQSDIQVSVDSHVRFDQDLSTYDLLYMTGAGDFELPYQQASTLVDFVDAGGAILYESDRTDFGVSDPPADKSFQQYFLDPSGIKLELIPADADLLALPNVFGALPNGYEAQPNPDVRFSNRGVMLSTADYTSLWSGLSRAGAASRDSIRAALEWGENVLNWALSRAV